MTPRYSRLPAGKSQSRFVLGKGFLEAGGRFALLTAVLLGLAVVLVIPRHFDFSHSFLENPGDPSLYVATWRWQWYALRQGYIHQFWQGWFYYPNRWVMGYTEHILGLMPVYKAYEWIFSSAPAASTAVVLSLFVLDGWAGYLVGRRIGGSYGSGFACAAVMSFSGLHFNHVAHMHVSAYFTVPLILLSLEDLMRRPGLARALGLGALWGATPLFSYYNWAIASVAIPVFSLSWLVVNGRLHRKRTASAPAHDLVTAHSLDSRAPGVEAGAVAEPDSASEDRTSPATTGRFFALLLVSAVVMVLLVAPLSFQFLAARSEIPANRTSAEIAAHSVKVSNLFQPAERSIAYNYLPAPLGKNDKIETIAYLGVSGVLLGIAGYFWPLGKLLASTRYRRRRRGKADAVSGSPASQASDTCSADGEAADEVLVKRLTPWFATALVGFFLMLGPDMRIRGNWPAVPGLYRLLAAVPGLSQLRAAGRFSLLVYLFVGVCAASAWARLSKRSWLGAAGILGLCALWIIEGAIAVGQTVPLPANAAEVPPHVQWLAGAERGATVELPMYFPGVPASSEAEALRLYVSTYDWQPRVNGYSGYEPVGYRETVSDLAGFPSSVAMDRLESLGVRYVVVDFPALARYRKGGPDAAYYRWEYPDLRSSEAEIRDVIASTSGLELRADFGSTAVYELVARRQP